MIPLVVRPEPQATSLSQALLAAGHQPVVSPLLSFVEGVELDRLPALLADLSARDYVIAVSVQAVNFADNALKQQGSSWPDAHYIAVGEATGNAFDSVGVPGATVPDDPRSEGVISLPELRQLTGRRVVILRGNGGRHLIAPTLMQAGALVDYCEVYRRHYHPDPNGTLVKSWQSQGVDSIIITSGGLLNHLVQLTATSARDWLTSRLLIVPSIRVALEARELGFTQVINAEGASNQALIDALDERKRNDRQDR
ncbi:uroporphyrinogen-III synthase [Oceanisphaera psychrotolerans]|uniref:Uroporphyrinogen-III synthase n=1 Tax=Oceanisphaera psychrotolerans TaxID=1414654 RepID=A0A1J4QKX8_9GAMM|nr:uroporphyrinogen-III synthase [Oceanisphaera psychrotolerans]OIN14271.1 uroporphyrinogen-III synthase [Oceanisphaera psychrotolerans]